MSASRDRQTADGNRAADERRPTHPGPTLLPEGVRFTLHSWNASAARVELWDDREAVRPRKTVELERAGDGPAFTAVLPQAGIGSLYTFRVEGPDAPELGHRFDPARSLIDPWARAVCGPPRWRDRVLAPDSPGSPQAPPKAVVIDPTFDWGADRPPRVPWADTVLYEAHPWMTLEHPDIEPRLRGTYEGLASEPILEHLAGLGVTAIELLPVAASVSEPHLAARGATNAWGYSPIAFFAPDARYATDDLGAQVDEFRRMVAAFHAAGIEVILDVVYNHTGEGAPDGPALSLRGIDHAAYYRLDPDDPTKPEDWTGCGNTLDVIREPGRRLVLDALHYWVEAMHVDGFRFDLAASLARDPARPDGLSELVQQIAADPRLSGIKRIAEPWDLGPSPSFAGRFPSGFAEWNDAFRDASRRFWRGDPTAVGELATRMAGSADRFEPGGRSPLASIHYVTAHDGFCLADLVAYERKHNDENGEEGRDGADENLSRNCGVEGPTDDDAIRVERERTARSLLATLFLSAGVPMLLWGDELGRTQRGNNNGYQLTDDRILLPWGAAADRRLAAFVRRLARVRRSVPAFKTGETFRGEPRDGTGPRDLVWYRPDGEEMSEADWHDPERRAVAARFHVKGVTTVSLLNGGDDSIRFTMPPATGYRLEIDTSRPEAEGAMAPDDDGAHRVDLPGHTFVLLRELGEARDPRHEGRDS